MAHSRWRQIAVKDYAISVLYRITLKPVIGIASELIGSQGDMIIMTLNLFVGHCTPARRLFILELQTLVIQSYIYIDTFIDTDIHRYRHTFIKSYIGLRTHTYIGHT